MVRFSSDGEIFNRTSPTFGSPGALVGCAAAGITSGQKRVVVTGGIQLSVTTKDEVHVFDLATRTWLPAGNMNLQRSYHQICFKPNRSRLYVTFGATGPASWTNTMETIDVQAPFTGEIVVSNGTGPVDRGYHSMICPNSHDSIVIAGGFRAGAALADVWRFSVDADPKKGTWGQLPSLPAPIMAAAMSLIVNQYLWVFGGRNPSIGASTSPFAMELATGLWVNVTLSSVGLLPRYNAAAASFPTVAGANAMVVIGGDVSPQLGFDPSCYLLTIPDAPDFSAATTASSATAAIASTTTSTTTGGGAGSTISAVSTGGTSGVSVSPVSSGSPPSTSTHSGATTTFVIIGVVSAVLLLVLIAGAVVMLRRRDDQHTGSAKQSSSSVSSSSATERESIYNNVEAAGKTTPPIYNNIPDAGGKTPIYNNLDEVAGESESGMYHTLNDVS
jgi:Galactose oxidase, central domain